LKSKLNRAFLRKEKKNIIFYRTCPLKDFEFNIKTDFTTILEYFKPYLPHIFYLYMNLKILIKNLKH
jgi:hypothetical protein